MRYSQHTLAELSAPELLEILRLRVDVFVVEQQCPYPEVDEHDERAIHVAGRDTDGKLIAYARILPPDAMGLPHIGRVVVRAEHRGRGLATTLLQHALRIIAERHGTTRCALAAQHHLRAWYARFGFRAVGAVYDLDGIPHVDMVREG